MINFTGAWDRLKALLAITYAQITGTIDKAIEDEAHRVADLIRRGIVTQAPGGQHFRPISEFNQRMRDYRGISGSDPMFARGELFNAIGVYKEGSSYLAGVLPTVTRKQEHPGFSMLALAWIQENGAVLQTGLGLIVVPPRPFVGPIYREWMADPKRIGSGVLRNVGRLVP